MSCDGCFGEGAVHRGVKHTVCVQCFWLSFNVLLSWALCVRGVQRKRTPVVLGMPGGNNKGRIKGSSHLVVLRGSQGSAVVWARV